MALSNTVMTGAILIPFLLHPVKKIDKNELQIMGL